MADTYDTLLAARRAACCADRPRSCPWCLAYADGVEAALAAGQPHRYERVPNVALIGGERIGKGSTIAGEPLYRRVPAGETSGDEDVEVLRAERDRLAERVAELETHLIEARSAFDEVTGDYSKELVDGEAWYLAAAALSEDGEDQPSVFPSDDREAQP